MGDGVLAYFGYPQAHEHDAERAVRAGLAIVEAAPKLQTAAGAPLQVRAGIATGIVVVGDLLGSGEAQERGVVGIRRTWPRGCRLSPRRTASSSARARRLLGDLFDVVDLCLQDLKGVTGLTRAYVALKESSRESRFEALHAGRLTALVGREEESELLLRRWAKANSGEGQIVLLSGEAGIGKSRPTATSPAAVGRAPPAAALLLFAAAHGERALSDHQSIGAGGVDWARGRHENQARQARRAPGRVRYLTRGRLASRRNALLAERRPLSGGRTRPAVAGRKLWRRWSTKSRSSRASRRY